MMDKSALKTKNVREEKERAEEMLKISETRFRRLFETAQDGILILNADTGMIEVVNPFLIDMLGYSHEELLGKRLWEIGFFKDIGASQSAFKELQDKKYIRYEDLPLETKDGWCMEVEFISNVYKVGGKKVIQCNIRDIKGRKVSKATRESEEKYRGLFENMPIGLYRTTPEGQIIDANPALIQMLGYPDRESLLITNVLETYLNPEMRTRWESLMKCKGVVRNFEKQLRRCDEKIIWVQENARAACDAEGRIQYYEGSFQDITERKYAEQEKASLEEQLRQSQRMESIGSLAGGIAHDFNNLLTVIGGVSQLSLLDLKESDPLRVNIEEIQEAVERAANLTRQLLVFSRGQIMKMQILNLNTVLRDLEKMLRRVLSEDIELIIALAGDLGKVKADPGQIEQVIMNLVINAKDAMSSGGKLMIETANMGLDEEYTHSYIGVTPGQYVMVSVSDTGVGMTKEVKERIFEPFFTTKEKGKGTGLGLSTVYGIVKQSEGHIWVYSEPEHGTTFKIYLPRADAPLEVWQKNEVVERTYRGSETVLLVEDDVAVRKIALRVLEKQGYKVLETSDWGEALRFSERKNGPIHLVLVDVVMPGMSGPKLVEQLRQVCQDFKVLYMSGYTDDVIFSEGLLDKEANFIEKPFMIDKFAKKVREVLDN